MILTTRSRIFIVHTLVEYSRVIVAIVCIL